MSEPPVKPVRHILSLSGGKDSAALAIYMRDRVANMEYIFHDAGKELDETYEFLARIEAYLGKPVHRTTPPNSFDHWYKVYGEIVPSNHRRWCTRMLKLKPLRTGSVRTTLLIMSEFEQMKIELVI